ncbi:hypothetical protein F4778DRAFT_788172 [Xylariomycetidae sp. FL2044]|nr:hypothetical protein F4778DRAFT_788172 [Xylariomycetidae sp. FL2044]
MCFPVQYLYTCGCVENTRFECPRSPSFLHCEHELVTTPLDHPCHDCSRLGLVEFPYDTLTDPAAYESLLRLDARALTDRDVNVPTIRPPSPDVLDPGDSQGESVDHLMG